MMAIHLIDERRKNRSVKRLDTLLVSFLHRYGLNSKRNFQRSTVLKVPFLNTSAASSGTVTFENVRLLNRIATAFKVAYQRLLKGGRGGGGAVERVLHINKLTLVREKKKRSGVCAVAELESFLSVYEV
jgi:hypothetical protein